MVTQEQMIKGLSAYLDREMMPKIHMEPWKMFTIGTGAAVLVKRLAKATETLKDNKMLNALGVVDADGNIDIDILAETAKTNIPPEGLRIPVPVLGEIILHPSDIDILYQMIGGAE